MNMELMKYVRFLSLLHRVGLISDNARLDALYSVLTTPSKKQEER